MSSIQAALRSRRFLATSWPWRALLYLVTSALVAAPAAAGAWLFALPWMVVANDLRLGRVPETPKLVLIGLSVIMFAALAPLVAVPLAAVERRRLALADTRPIVSAHRAVPPDPISWLRVRYTEAATWREVAYGLLLTLVAPVVYTGLALVAILDVALLVAPVLAVTEPMNLGRWTVDTPGEALVATLVGLLLVVPLVYLVAVVAAGQAAAARALLGDSGTLREVTRSRARLVDAFEAERSRIQRDLHDGAQHQLTSLTLQLGMARLDLPADSPATDPLDRAHTQAKDLMVMLRDIVHGIRPQVLSDLGLVPALRELAARTPLPVHIAAPDVVSRPPEQVETTAFFVASEALGNVAKHALATRVDVSVEWAGECLVMEIRDDGAGGADPSGGTGLTGLADRVAAVGGRLLLSSPAGAGTLLRVELPCRW